MNATENQPRVHPPPRLLTGAAVLFWGAMTGRPLIGLALALLVESPNWVKWRWDFDEAAISRTWQLVTVLTALVLVLILLEGERAKAMPLLVTWLPALLLPMQLAQSFGMRRSMTLSSFSYFAKRRQDRNRRHGLEEPEVHVNFGNIYLVVTLVASTLGHNAEAGLFLPGLLVLGIWRFTAMPGRRPLALVAVFAMAGGAALLGQAALNRAYDWLNHFGGSGSQWMSDATHARTAIGALHDVKLSNDIVWRIRTEEGQRAPRLLRRATFDRYQGVTWRIASIADPEWPPDRFRDVDSVEPVVGEAYYLTNPRLPSDQAIAAELPRFEMRGSLRPGAAMPLPSDTASITGFELDAIERNPLGTVRVFPSVPVLHGLVLWNSGETPESPPIERHDLRVPSIERDGLRRALESAGVVPGMTAREVIARIGAWFAGEFNYTLYLSMDSPRASAADGTPITWFLESTRRGHCEYFATAAALMMREAGFPARYCTGYAVIERDTRRREFVVRGIHGHAWCRVWIEEENRWIDFDPTPPDWLALETRGDLSLRQRMVDWVQRHREDLFVWRSDPRNRLILAGVLSVPGLVVIVLVGRRLWRSRRLMVDGGGRPLRAGDTTPLWMIESAARRHLGARPPGVPYARWLAPLAGPEAAGGETLAEAIELHQWLRFDPAARGDATATRRLAGMARKLRRDLRRQRNSVAMNDVSR
jgi:transglutaminase-like putative cysteine protease